MGLKQVKIKQSAVFTALLLVLVGFIGFVEKKGAERSYHGLSVKVHGISDVYFVEEDEITSMLLKTFPHLTEGAKLEDIQLSKLEERVERHPFVKNAEVYNNLKGEVLVTIDQYRPMARITRPLAADGYISAEGLILPTSSHYTSRVLILEGDGVDDLLAAKDLSKEHQALLDLIYFIDRSEFWSAQIASIEVARNGDISLYQQVGRQRIEFGKPVDIADKFERINMFYEEIIPKKGWDAYSRVNVEFKDQIICE
ncbi:cell division protein [Echinicola strongylocentroti]|uniref:Cell division protein n=1 Tax=Echinicola strongylocentroti TaxID=1795355 RepID=A0A2Z4IG51_9BACT|nr:cell division protein [Echinicola strongylocentroti]AWW30082.1 cell division protein [Echinicola strongylocentroti]